MATEEPQRSGGRSSSSSSIQGIRRLLHLKKHPESQHPLIPPLTTSTSAGPTTKSKKNGGLPLCSLGCASSSSASQALPPAAAAAAAAAVRSSAEWQGKRRPRKRRVKMKGRPHLTSSTADVADVSDVWCAPGVVFGAEASVDCVEAHRKERVPRGKPCIVRRGADAEIMSLFMECDSVETPHIESGLSHSELLRPIREVRRRVPAELDERPCIARVGGDEEITSLLIDFPSMEMSRIESGPSNSGQLRRIRGGHRRSPAEFDEVRMFQTRVPQVFLDGVGVYDKYNDLRLDVDNMSYEELLELSEKIGYVSTGLREEEILSNLRKQKHSFFGASPSQKERKCTICQEEYEANDEMGRLQCGHSYHTYCIKQWLLRKNTCPVCKTAMSKS